MRITTTVNQQEAHPLANYPMKRLMTTILALALLTANLPISAQTYTPTPENLKARQEFADSKFGIFLHWGLYSMFAQGEWYMNRGIDSKEYSRVKRSIIII